MSELGANDPNAANWKVEGPELEQPELELDPTLVKTAFEWLNSRRLGDVMKGYYDYQTAPESLRYEDEDGQLEPPAYIAAREGLLRKANYPNYNEIGDQLALTVVEGLGAVYGPFFIETMLTKHACDNERQNRRFGNKSHEDLSRSRYGAQQNEIAAKVEKMGADDILNELSRIGRLEKLTLAEFKAKLADGTLETYLATEPLALHAGARGDISQTVEIIHEVVKVGTEVTTFLVTAGTILNKVRAGAKAGREWWQNKFGEDPVPGTDPAEDSLNAGYL